MCVLNFVCVLNCVCSQGRLVTLKKQADLITQQAQREKDSFLKERTNLQMMLQRVCTHTVCVSVCECVCVLQQSIDFSSNCILKSLSFSLSRRRKITLLLWKGSMLTSQVGGASLSALSVSRGYV